MQKAAICPNDQRKANQANDARQQGVSGFDALVSALGAHEVHKLDAYHNTQVEQQRHHKDRDKAAYRYKQSARRDKEMEIRNLGFKERCGKKHHELRKGDAADDAKYKCRPRNDKRLIGHYARHLSARHSQYLVQTKLALTALHDEVIGIDHQKAHNGRKEDGEPGEQLGHDLAHAGSLDARNINLQ